MIQIISTFATTDIVPADSHGPYLVPGGSPITLSAGVPNPHATYEWDLGDGTTANTPSVNHIYGDNGLYVAKLTVVVQEAGGARSRHFALIQVTNVPPTVELGPTLTINEGDRVQFTGTFTDPEWLDTHVAKWFWDDGQSAEAGVIAETHQPPAARGTVLGSHAWGDNGTYQVLLEVTDDDGGVGRATQQVVVLNVPPIVHPLAPMFAYPCSVLTLTAAFTDPGWLDQHIASWRFGDCTGTQTAVVREERLPPAGQGVAIASHVYHRCGTYEAVCEVIDDDGGVGRMATVISVVQLENADFEGGFRGRRLGTVANHWEPYVAAIPALPQLGQPGAGERPPSVPAGSALPAAPIFAAEPYWVHSGERAQRIHFRGLFRAGIRQGVGANPGWDYQISAHYSLDEAAGGRSVRLADDDNPAHAVPPAERGGIARLGIDPQGGQDPEAASVVWSEGELRRNWEQLTVRATAVGRAITVFLEGQGAGELAVDVCFDDVTLTPVQPFCPPGKRTDGPQPPPRPTDATT